MQAVSASCRRGAVARYVGCPCRSRAAGVTTQPRWDRVSVRTAAQTGGSTTWRDAPPDGQNVAPAGGPTVIAGRVALDCPCGRSASCGFWGCFHGMCACRRKRRAGEREPDPLSGKNRRNAGTRNVIRTDEYCGGSVVGLNITATFKGIIKLYNACEQEYSCGKWGGRRAASALSRGVRRDLASDGLEVLGR